MSYGRNENNTTINNIILEINRLNELSEMKPKKYANEGGYADKIAKEFSSGRGDSQTLNTNQLRKFFGAIRDIESKEGEWEEKESTFYLLKPKLAVAVGRKNIPRKFYELMMACMNKVDVGDNEKNNENFKTLVEFLESIVAYRKFYDS